MKRSVLVGFCALLVASVALADPGPPDPISIDRQSPSITFGETPANIYDMLLPTDPRFGLGWDTPAPAGMVTRVMDTSYGLTLQDNNDGHSNGELDPTAPLLIYFSGDDQSVGVVGTDYNHQAIRGQAAGDRFVTNGFTTVSPVVAMAGGTASTISGPIMPGGMGNFQTNLLSANQHRYNEIPSIGPAAYNTYVPPMGYTSMDDMDALELTPFDITGDMIHDTPIYFSLDAISPSLAGLSGADVLYSPANSSFFYQFAAASSLGLSAADEVDALAVWDMSGQGFAASGTDYALFSLAPGSPFLLNNPGFSAADIFVTDFSGANTLYLSAASLGMLPSDNIDAIDVEIWVDQFTFEEQLLDQTPEPATMSLLALGGLALLKRRRK